MGENQPPATAVFRTEGRALRTEYKGSQPPAQSSVPSLRSGQALSPQSFYIVRLVRDETDLRRLEGPWTELVLKSSAATIFSTFQWNAAWWRHFGEGKRLSVLTVWKVQSPKSEVQSPKSEVQSQGGSS